MTVVNSLAVVLAEGLVPRVKAAVESNAGGLRDAILDAVGNVRAVHQNSDGSWPTITRRPWLSYEWVASDPAAAWPTTENGAEPGDRLVGMSEAFLPGTPGTTTTTPETRTAAFTEQFTGLTDGAAWPTSRWVTGVVGATTGAVKVEGGAGRLTSGSTGGYASKDLTGVTSAMSPLRDVEVLFDFTLGATTDSEVRVQTRTPETDGNMATGLAVGFKRTGVEVAVANMWAFKALASTTAVLDAGVTYRARVVTVNQADGSVLIRARYWPAGGTEPATWSVDTTTREAGADQAGHWGFALPGAAVAGQANTVLVDKIAAYTRPADTTPEWWGAR